MKNPLVECEIISSVFHSNFTYIQICLSQQKRKIGEYASIEEKFLLEIHRMNNTTQVGVGRNSVLVNGVFIYVKLMFQCIQVVYKFMTYFCQHGGHLVPF